MLAIVNRPDTEQKLRILSADAQYDLACACGSSKYEHRKRSSDGKWIYPITLPNGGTSVLFKTLMSNVCTNDCRYCPLREQADIRRCSLSPEETANTFLDYFGRREVFGLFLSSGVCGSPDAAMERLNAVAGLLRRKHRFKGYIHLKIIPGAGESAIRQALSLSTAVSLNIEVPGEKFLAKLSTKKNYIKDIIEPVKLISRLTARGAEFSRVKQTTQFVVGSAGETDRQIVNYTAALYKRLKMHRVYFSAYQKELGDIRQENAQTIVDSLTREHRLYQVDFLFRKYGFDQDDIIFSGDGSLSLDYDPKELWAMNHPERFPVNVNSASRFELLRVPGLGPIMVNTILERREQARLTNLTDIYRPNSRLRKAEKYLAF
jgi:predicted DNA-binding helix-hairpin-helix protein